MDSRQINNSSLAADASSGGFQGELLYVGFALLDKQSHKLWAIRSFEIVLNNFLLLRKPSFYSSNNELEGGDL